MVGAKEGARGLIRDARRDWRAGPAAISMHGRILSVVEVASVSLPSSFRRAVAFAVLACASFAVPAQSLINPRTPPPDRDPRSKGDVLPDYRQYEYGKEIYAVKLGCSTCPLGTTPLDETVAKRFFSDETLWDTLNDKEYDAVSVYLKQRFNLMM